MTKIEKEVKNAIKKGKAILGYRKSIKFLKLGKVKKIIIAKNIPESYKNEIEFNAKLNKLKVEIFDGTSKELGVICGRPHPVSTIVIVKD
ncbi:MAG: 50S ribosomal protein L30e [Candidatus Aenigmarchaeota archaeon ex4484_224]|nr:MAG: 50S ribosomal protein L30e [Candidatus Aenigmarchaeota archaeon ex4484_224]